jgi:hypothetical protein
MVVDASRFVGAGFLYVQTQLTDNSKHDRNKYNATNTHTQKPTQDDDDNSNPLSESAKSILEKLLTQQHHHPISLQQQPHRSTKNVSTQPQQETSSSKVIISSNMSDDTKLELAYNQELSLLGSILYAIEQYQTSVAGEGQSSNTASNNSTHTTSSSCSSRTSVPTKYILQQCAYTVIPQKTPAVLSSLEVICAALHFLCQRSSITTTTTSTVQPQVRGPTPSNQLAVLLPILYSTSMSSDIEKRTYDKVYDWNLSTLLPDILVLEDQFYNAYNSIPQYPSSTKPQPQQSAPLLQLQTHPLLWLPRELFVPDVSYMTVETQQKIYRHGTLPTVVQREIRNDSTIKQRRGTKKTMTSTAGTGSTPTTGIQIKRKQSSTTTTLPATVTSSIESEPDNCTLLSNERNQTNTERLVSTSTNNNNDDHTITTAKKMKITPSFLYHSKVHPSPPTTHLDRILSTEATRMMHDTSDDDVEA